MRTLFHLWSPRVHFGLLLLVFSELVFWQNASAYGPLDWLALAVIYIALGAGLLDLMARFHAYDPPSVMLVAGLFSITRAALLLHFDIGDHFLTDFILVPLGAGVIAFLLALASFRLLASGQPSGLVAVLLAGVVGLVSGIWLRWYPALDSVRLSVPERAEILVIMAALAIAGLLGMILRPRATMGFYDWWLTPYGWAVAGGVLFVTLVIRAENSDTISLSILLMLIVAQGFMLAFTKRIRRRPGFLIQTPPNPPFLIGWLALLIPFGVLAWLGYGMSQGMADALITAFLVFGVGWLPTVSAKLGIDIFSGLTREGY